MAFNPLQIYCTKEISININLSLMLNLEKPLTIMINIVGKKTVKNLVSLCIYEFNKKKDELVNNINSLKYVSFKMLLFMNKVYILNINNIFPPSGKYFDIYLK